MAVKFGDTRVDLFQADRVRVPHRTAAICGKAVAIDINDVDIRSAQRVAFLENARAFVDQSVEATIHDFRQRKFSAARCPLPPPICAISSSTAGSALRDAVRRICTSRRQFSGRSGRASQRLSSTNG